jgi:hypothetical protein
MAKVLYVSPLFSTNNESRKFMIEEKGVKYHAKRDAAVLALKALGGLDAPDTLEVRALRKAILSAKRAIERNGFYSTVVQ